jgi:hypothetical protein
MPGSPTSRSLGATNPISQPLSSTGAPSRQARLRLSQAVESRIEAGQARERQRTWLLNTLLLAQAFMALALIPSFIIPKLNLVMLISVGVALALYGAVYIINRMPGKFALAVALLIFGGVCVTTAQVFLTALLSHSSYNTAQSALFYLPIIIEAGLFLSPELTLGIAAVAGILTGSGILLALALEGGGTELGLAYQLVVNSLGLEALVSFMAWQLANFIFEKNAIAQTVEDLRFSQARLDALQRQMSDQRRALQKDAGQIQAAVSSMLSHEYDARVDIQDGELAPIAASLNLLFERLRSTNALEHKMQQTEAYVPPLVGMAERMAEAGAPTHPDVLGSAGALYPVGVALSNAQAAQARRLASLFQLSSDIADDLRATEQEIEAATGDASRAHAQVGRLTALAEKMRTYAEREVDLLAQSRRLLTRLLPKEVTDAPEVGQRDPLLTGPLSSTPGELAGLMTDIGLTDEASGLTGKFDALTPAGQRETGIAPLTRQMATLGEEAGDSGRVPSVFAAGEIPGELVDAWGLLREAHSLAAQNYHDVDTMLPDMGVLSRSVREAEERLDWSRKTLEGSLQRADLAQSISGATGADVVDESVARLNPPVARPRPQATRPLTGELRLPESAAQAQNPLGPTPAPGSIRVSDLLNQSDLPFGRPGEPGNPTER